MFLIVGGDEEILYSGRVWCGKELWFWHSGMFFFNMLVFSIAS